MDTRVYQKKFEEAMEGRKSYYEDVRKNSTLEAIAYAVAWIAAELMLMRMKT